MKSVATAILLFLSIGVARAADPEGAQKAWVAPPAPQVNQPGAGAIFVPPSGSLLFSDIDADSIQRAIAAFERMSNLPVAEIEQSQSQAQAEASPGVRGVRPSGVPNVYVSAVMDFGEGQWVVWANGYRISPEHQAPEFSVVSVKKNSVEVFVPGDQPARFHLHPYQTWRSRHHDIVEGILP